MTRDELFKALRPAFPGHSFTPDAVRIIDDIADKLGMERITSPAGDWLPPALALIKEFEGCRLTAYPDPGTGGVPWTIGWGSTRDEQGKAIVPGTTWTQERADARLAADVGKFAAGVDSALGGAATTANQKAAMVSLAYNVGVKAFAGSTLLKLHKAGDYAGAAARFADWNKAAGKVLKGLTRRREAEARVYRS